MSRITTTLAAFLIMSQAVAVTAGIFNFRATETSALSSTPTTFTFALDTAQAALGTSGATTFANIAISRNGILIPANTVGDQYDTNLSSPLFFFVDTGSTPFSSGTGTGITFNTGKFAIADGATDGEGTLNISTIPEPSLWMLMIAGVGFVGLKLRYRRRRMLVAGAA